MLFFDSCVTAMLTLDLTSTTQVFISVDPSLEVKQIHDHPRPRLDLVQQKKAFQRNPLFSQHRQTSRECAVKSSNSLHAFTSR